MRKKSVLAISVVLLLAAGVAAMSVSSAAAPSAARPRVWPKSSAAHAAAATAAAKAAAKAKHATRLVLILRLVDAREFDGPPVAESPGDTTLATFDAFTPGGRRVGHTEARSTSMFRDELFAEVTILLDGRGQILVEGIAGPPDTDPQPVLAVVGGTGEFRNARGQVFRLPGPTPDETKLVFALLL
jgi:hypothetical protein